MPRLVSPNWKQARCDRAPSLGMLPGTPPACAQGYVCTRGPGIPGNTCKGQVESITGPFKGRYRSPEGMPQPNLVSTWFLPLRTGLDPAAAERRQKPRRTKTTKPNPGGIFPPRAGTPPVTELVIDITWHVDVYPGTPGCHNKRSPDIDRNQSHRHTRTLVQSEPGLAKWPPKT